MPRKKVADAINLNPIVEDSISETSQISMEEAKEFYNNFYKEEDIQSLQIFTFVSMLVGLIIIIIGSCIRWGFGGFLISLGASIAYFMYFFYNSCYEELMDKFFYLRDFKR